MSDPERYVLWLQNGTMHTQAHCAGIKGGADTPTQRVIHTKQVINCIATKVWCLRCKNVDPVRTEDRVSRKSRVNPATRFANALLAWRPPGFTPPGVTPPGGLLAGTTVIDNRPPDPGPPPILPDPVGFVSPLAKE